MLARWYRQRVDDTPCFQVWYGSPVGVFARNSAPTNRFSYHYCLARGVTKSHTERARSPSSMKRLHGLTPLPSNSGIAELSLPHFSTHNRPPERPDCSNDRQRNSYSAIPMSSFSGPED